MYSGVRVLTYNEAFEKITNYLDDEEKNDEMKDFIIYDYKNGHSNQVNIEMTQKVNHATGTDLFDTALC